MFKKYNIGGIEINNCVFRSATEEGLADENGRPTEALIRKYEMLARGEIGCIITGFLGVSEQGKSSIPGMCLLDSDDKIDAYRQMVDRIHALRTPIIAQIAHCGQNGVMKRAGNVNRLREEQIYEIIDDFVQAAIRAKKAGFDGVQLHCAHLYLLSHFLSKSTNHRKDQWGGSLDHRFRIVKEILENIRRQCPDYPIFVKMNGYEVDHYEKSLADAVEIAKRMEQCGVNAIEVSCGINFRKMGATNGQVPTDMILQEMIPSMARPLVRPLIPLVIGKTKNHTLYNLDAAKRIKSQVSIPVIVVGGIRSVADIEKAMQEVDAVSMSRALILEPGLIRKFKEQKQTMAKCIQCNYCLIGVEKRPLRCYYGRIKKGTDI